MARALASPFRFLSSAASALGAASLVSAAPAPSEAAVKAAFLSKFGAYVDWPGESRSGDGAPIVLCLVGGDPFGKLLDEAAHRQQIGGRQLLVKRLSRPDDDAGCAIAFVSSGAMLEAMKNKPVLTVTDARTSVQRGMIHFVVSQGRVRFHIDEASAVRSRLAINSRLLALALSVRQRN